MFRRKFWILALLMLFLFLVPTASATPPTDVSGWFDWADGDPYSYCFYTGDYLNPDGVIQGCVIQPDSPGRAAHGTFYDLPYPFDDDDEPRGECEYNLATFDIPGRPDDPGDPHFTMNRCSGSLQGVHMVGTGVAGGFTLQGTLHVEPQ